MAPNAAHRGRFAAAFAVLAFCAVLIVAGGAWWAFGRSSSSKALPCNDAIPTGQTIAAAWRTTALFAEDMLLNRSPGCGYDLSTERLHGGRSREEWIHGGSPVRGFRTHYPPVPIKSASHDPAAHQAVYILSRRAAAFVVIGEGGRAEIPMMIGLAAPDAGRGAYNVVLVIEKGSWRVDRVKRVVITDSG